MEKILVLNPSSTSTKIAVFDGETPLFTESLTHSAEDLAPFDRVVEQYDFRRRLVLDCLMRHDFDVRDLNAIVSRGGLLAPIHAGAYEINEDMVRQLQYKPQNEHASNVGPMIAHALAKELNVPAYIYDGITVDELTDINRITGLPEMHRKGIGHNLNTRAAAMRYAREQGKAYKDITEIVAHLGGGITVNLHHNGRIEDCVNDEGPFSPERAGGLPMYDVIHRSFEEGQSDKNMMKLVKSRGGLLAHLGTTDCREVEHRIQNGDAHAKLIYDAMALNVAKFIGKTAPGVCGKVDAILLTGGITYSEYIDEEIHRRVDFIAPVTVYPGEDEMQSLAFGCLRVLQGEESARTYTKVE
jgi:butyrate kinase